MSRGVALIVVGALVGVLAAPTLQAQSAVADRPGPTSAKIESAATLEARLDSLVPLLREAERAEHERYQRDLLIEARAAAEQAQVDTVFVGPFRVVSPRDQIDTARELFEEVWEEEFAHLGESPKLSDEIFAFQWSNVRVPIHIFGNGQHVSHGAWRSRARVLESIRNAIAGPMNWDLAAAHAPLTSWAEGNVLVSPDLPDVYRYMATSVSKTTRACMEGSVTDCSLALGLPMWENGDPRRRISTEERLRYLRAWYTPDERRALAARSGGVWNEDELPDRHLCVYDGGLEACDRLLARRVLWGLDPLPPEVRTSLSAYAIEQGGAGAWDRLRADPERTPMRALEAASGLTIDELIARWRAHVIEHRVTPYRAIVPSSAMALLWLFVFSAFAMRSTRWRLG